jgi:hypothetical protein
MVSLRKKTMGTEEAEWIEFQADGDPLDQGVQV